MSKKEISAACDPTSLGSILKEHGLINEGHVSKALKFQVENADLLFGESLVFLGIISREILEATIIEQDLKRNGPRKSSSAKIRKLVQMSTRQTIALGATGLGLTQTLQNLMAKLPK